MSKENEPRVVKDERKAYSVHEIPAEHLAMLEAAREELEQDCATAKAKEANRDRRK